MTDKIKENNNFNSTNFLLFLYKWQKPLIIITVIAIIASVIFSSPYFITPKFKSTVIMFPSSSNSISKALLSENPSGELDILQFGDEEQAEQMLQILNSNKIRDRIVKKYDLIKHYDINETSKYKYTKLCKKYNSNITFRRTEFMAVEINVLDKNPQMAADIANNIAALLDTVKNNMQKQRAIKGFKIVEQDYLKLKKDVRKMEDSLTSIRKLGVQDYESQAEMINRQLSIELAKGNNAGINRLENKLDVLAKYGSAYVSLRDALEHEKKQLSSIKAKYNEAKIDAQETLPQKFIINNAYKAEKKIYPVRWLIVFVTTFASFLFSILIIIIIDNITNIKIKKKNLTYY